MSKLDRFLVSEGIFSIFPSITALCLDRHLSDHRPILLREVYSDFGPIPFRFYHSWISRLLYDVGSRIRECIVLVKKSIKNELSDIDKEVDRGVVSDTNLFRHLELQRKLHDINHMEAKDSFQNSKIKWAIEGDENLKFFHGIINKKRSQLEIRGVFDNGLWCTDPGKVKEVFFNHFEARFKKPVAHRFMLNFPFNKRLSDMQAADLERNVSREEIWLAVWNCGENKSPDVLEAFRFCQTWCKWIRGTFSSARASVLVNDSPSNEFSFHCRLKQGDPLSPYLFILIMESLHMSSSRAVDEGLFKGVHLQGSISISHLFYADDAMFIEEWSDANLKGVMVGECMSRHQAWDDTVLKLRSRLSNWKVKTLSIGDRLTLLKSVIGASPLYNMSIFKKITWAAWDKILASKKNGGLGVSSFYALNRAFLLKWVWRFISQDGPIWFRVIQALYGPSIVSHPVNLSSNWCSIVRELHLLTDKELDKEVLVADKIKVVVGHSFRRPVRAGSEHQQMVDLNSLLESVSLSQSHDRWFCDLTCDGEFRVKEVRNFLDNLFLPSDFESTRWVKYIPIKINVFAWRARRDYLPTRANLNRRGIILNSSTCHLCQSYEEDINHVLFRCELAQIIIRRICRWWELDWQGLMSFSDWQSWISSIRLPSKVKNMLEGALGDPKKGNPGKKKEDESCPVYDTDNEKDVEPASKYDIDEDELVTEDEECTSKGKVCNMIIDEGSCENVVSTYMVKKLALKTVDHPEPYQLSWLKKRNVVKVSKRCFLQFSSGKKYQEGYLKVASIDDKLGFTTIKRISRLENFGLVLELCGLFISIWIMVEHEGDPKKGNPGKKKEGESSGSGTVAMVAMSSGINPDAVSTLGHPADQALSVLQDKIDLKGFQSFKPCELIFFDNQWHSEPYDDERDNNDGGGINSSSVKPAVESVSVDSTFTADPYASTSNKSADSSNVSNHELDSVDKLGSINTKGGADDDGAALYDDENIYEGEGLDLYNLNMLLQENINEDRTKGGQSIRRSSRNLNKTFVPKSFNDVVLDSKWVDAINSEIEALNRNNTWVITDLPKGRKPIGSDCFCGLRLGQMHYSQKTITGYAVYLGDSLVSWISKRQYVLAKSSAEAEYKAISSVAREIAANPVIHERTKHFEIDLFFLREKIAEGVFKNVKIKSDDNVSDLFTNGLLVFDHKRFCDLLHLKDHFHA
uniref:RNA-directed DNA polymerase, eukaryota n=1 Tax=Tanacetum cinerariifolium TaxID=118510 RepID=A0A6L2JCI3_TANCI|nr:RNA-directed DNA polymerase, eukaryota [Tanacetum cinerariifolium]